MEERMTGIETPKVTGWMHEVLPYYRIKRRTWVRRLGYGARCLGGGDYRKDREKVMGKESTAFLNEPKWWNSREWGEWDWAKEVEKCQLGESKYEAVREESARARKDSRRWQRNKERRKDLGKEEMVVSEVWDFLGIKGYACVCALLGGGQEGRKKTINTTFLQLPSMVSCLTMRARGNHSTLGLILQHY